MRHHRRKPRPLHKLNPEVACALGSVPLRGTHYRSQQIPRVRVLIAVWSAPLLSFGLDARRLVYASNSARCRGAVSCRRIFDKFVPRLLDAAYGPIRGPDGPRNQRLASGHACDGKALGGIVAVAIIPLFAQQGLATIAALSFWALAIGAQMAYLDSALSSIIGQVTERIA